MKILDRWTAKVGNKRMIAVSDYVRKGAARDLQFAIESIDLIYNPFDIDSINAPVVTDHGELLGDLSDELRSNLAGSEVPVVFTPYRLGRRDDR